MFWLILFEYCCSIVLPFLDASKSSDFILPPAPCELIPIRVIKPPFALSAFYGLLLSIPFAFSPFFSVKDPDLSGGRG